MAILRLFSALRERRGVPNRKKVAKSSLFLFLRLADRRDGANPAKDESHTHRNQGIHLQSDKKTARRRFRSQIYGWASRIRTYITGTKNQGPAIGRWPSVCHKAFVIITYLAWSSQTNSRFAKTPQPNMSAVMPRTGRGEPIALLAPKTPRHSQQQH